MHQKAGTDHQKLLQLKTDQLLAGSTMMVTLEPCTHQSRTGPCVDAIIKAGIKEVIVATRPELQVRASQQAKVRGASIRYRSGCLWERPS